MSFKNSIPNHAVLYLRFAIKNIDRSTLTGYENAIPFQSAKANGLNNEWLDFFQKYPESGYVRDLPLDYDLALHSLLGKLH